ncbi:hypothetical protein P7F73_18155 [Enterobacter sp. EC-ML 621]|uniref:hypothetical protein n=1 Tax=Enterobacter sp. EC-ML 621 TaxID=3037555 RepID=UPI002853C0CA|nr:hypothetical protein [Enterobacter sp. EC-ML 621]MDR5095738.1 hypothetical protein [Enterobacter sp. EC-ML 621]
MNGNIELLNYSQEAIKFLNETERNVSRIFPMSAYVMRNVIDLISKSTKFILPNCADFIDVESFSQTHLDLARLPYPVVTFEIPWVKDTPLKEYKDFPNTLSTKRIALCIDYSDEHKHLCPVPNLDRLLESFPQGGVLVFSVYFNDRDKSWVLCQGGSFVPYDNHLEKLSEAKLQSLPASVLATEQLKSAGQLPEKNLTQFIVEPFIALPEFASEMERAMGGRDKLFADIILNTRDEVFAYIGACSLLNCANVIVEPVNATTPDTSRKLPPSARKKLKPVPKPKFEYKVLQISDERTSHSKSSAGATDAAAGTPRRTHLRRGHIRRLKERVIWVRPAVINPGSSVGVINKDYQLKTS